MGCGWSAGEHEVNDVEVIRDQVGGVIDGLALFPLAKKFGVAVSADLECNRSTSRWARRTVQRQGRSRSKIFTSQGHLANGAVILSKRKANRG
jgi:hypothetical protein